MPRAESAGILRGGQPAPGVAETFRGQKGESENRLQTAMREAGASQRTSDTNAAGMAQAQIQAAAQKEQMDRASAERIDAQKMDQDFQTLRAQQTHEDAVERDTAARAYEDAVFQKQYDIAKKLDAQVQAHEQFRTAQIEKGISDNRRLIEKTGEAQGRLLTAKSLLHNDGLSQIKKHEQIAKEKMILKSSAMDKLTQDLSTEYVDKYTAPSINVPGPVGGLSVPMPSFLSREGKEKALEEFNRSNFNKSVDSILSENGLQEVSVNMLESKNIATLEKMIQDGKFDPPDYWRLAGVLEASKEYAQQRSESAQSEGERAFYSGQSHILQVYLNNLNRLDSSEAPLYGYQGGQFTVGSVISEGKRFWAPFDELSSQQKEQQIEDEYNQAMLGVQSTAARQGRIPGIVTEDDLTDEQRANPYLRDLVWKRIDSAKTSMPKLFESTPSTTPARK